ncbi:hypothetical protein ASN18_1720 [Candidatus Magnetominusculus xianensis]|uniref:DUF2281 domain-containing protein n=2 Tax=Candidatus Magnetominusculus xianensis TaxID=1748249 RepID=A0ABR5SJ30_9BACT|nr:hypothetical protein ASN18_1720 [Candidatus Magnetominusculus xianensis]
MIANTQDIERINEMLKELSPETIASIVAFIAYQADRERRHKIFVEETLAAEQEPMLTFNSAQEAFDAIFSEV